MTYLVGFSTIDSEEKAGTIARQLVEEKLVACVNIIPGLRSIYRWKNRICDEGELLMVMKTTETNQEKVMARLKELHPYDVPEMIFLPITNGLPEYLSWIDEQQ